MPTLESLYRQDPESLPFRQPVDPSLLGIPVCVSTCELQLCGFYIVILDMAYLCSSGFVKLF